MSKCLHPTLMVTISLLLHFSSINAQDFSNKGKDFWVGYGYHQSMSVKDNQQDMVIYFTSDDTATVRVEIPSRGWSRTYRVYANTVKKSDPIPKQGYADARLTTEGVSNAGIHITSNKPIVAYAHIYRANRSGASLLFPVNTLGYEYYSLNFTQKANLEKANSWAFVVATEDSTSVEITPSAPTLTHEAGKTFFVTLYKGQIYNLMGTTSGTKGVDLTGTRIRSISAGNKAPKKIAVFAGTGHISISCDARQLSGDNIIQQVFPQTAWGRRYLTVPTAKLTKNYFRIAVADSSTVVKINGERASNLINGLYYEITANTPQSIVANKPVMVAQYLVSTNACGNSFAENGDPEMIYLSPLEQTIDKITLNSTNHYNITSHYINVIIRSSYVKNFRLDGKSYPDSFITHPKKPQYSYAVFTVDQGHHTLVADSGFNAIAYGYGFHESYGYNAGTNIKRIDEVMTLRNPYADANSLITCKNTSFRFSVALGYKPEAITWDFANSPNVAPAAAGTKNKISPDSVITRDGHQLYLYQLPASFTISKAGTYPVKIIATMPAEDGESDEREMFSTIEVTEAPVADFTYNSTGCLADSASFQEATYSNERKIVKWLWKFSDGTTVSDKNTSKLFSSAGSYPVRLIAINDIGCFSDTTKTLGLAPKPTAKFVAHGTNCSNTTITFMDSSTIDAGKIVKWDWNFGNGDTLTGTTRKQLTKMYPAGTYTISLQTENNTGCKSAVFNKVITIKPAPQVAFSALGTMCISDSSRIISEASETTGIAGTFRFSGNGISSSGVFHPSHAKAGESTIKYVYTSSEGCKDSAKQTIAVFENPVVKLNAPIKVFDGEAVILEPRVSDKGLRYSWFPSTYLDNSYIKNPKSAPREDITYKLTVTGIGGCSASATQLITTIKAPVAPNAFSPNGDGVNDVWNIPSLKWNPDCKVEVYNRNGQLMFTSTGYANPWNGTYNGKAVPEGVYYYIINPNHGQKVTSGTVALLK